MTEYLDPAIGKLVVRPDEPETETESGLVLPEAATEQPQRGTIVQVSAGWFENGTFVQTAYKVGDEVIYSRFAGTDLEVAGTEYKILRFTDLLGQVKVGA